MRAPPVASASAAVSTRAPHQHCTTWALLMRYLSHVRCSALLHGNFSKGVACAQQYGQTTTQPTSKAADTSSAWRKTQCAQHWQQCALTRIDGCRSCCEVRLLAAMATTAASSSAPCTAAPCDALLPAAGVMLGPCCCRSRQEAAMSTV